MLWKGAFGEQVMFIRDTLAALVSVGLDYEDRVVPQVISTHRSKSLTLPVVSLDRPDLGLRLILRNNFYNWKMSVISERPIVADYGAIFYTSPPVEPTYTGNPLADCYFEGFPADLIFGYLSENPRRFSAEVWGDYQLWTAIYLTLSAVGAIKPLIWSTKVSHRAELDAQEARRNARAVREKGEAAR